MTSDSATRAEATSDLPAKVLIVALALLVMATFVPLGVGAVQNQAFRPIWLYFFGMPLAPVLGFIAWIRNRYWIAAVLFLVTNVPLGGVIPVYLPLAIWLAAWAARRGASRSPAA